MLQNFKMKKRILLLEDEKHLLDNLKFNLELEGYLVIPVKDGESAISAFKNEKFDIAILDIMVPLIDGIRVAESIRLMNNKVPILFLSAKSSPEDRVIGLRKGGDDYLTKPFNLEELFIRIKKLISRNVQEQQKSNLIEFSFGSNYINFESYEAFGTNGAFTLTKKEALLLKLLIENKNEVVGRDKILHTVWGYSVYPSTRTIDNFILSFRKYFEIDPGNPIHFKSLRGVGYKFIE
ncbi:MAG: response regulator transcription factor [Bacteroidetes bacterium]|nr:response regulator transcription factor [Bacteroidota bacterium]